MANFSGVMLSEVEASLLKILNDTKEYFLRVSRKENPFFFL
jgi:hypothetical protein